MMRILQCSSNINSFLRYSSRTFKQTIKCDHQTFAKSPSKPFTSTPSFTVQKVRNICLVVSGGALVQIYLNNKVLCTPKHSRLAGYRDGTDKDIRFDWKRFWSYLNPQIWYFIAAIIGALAVALLNIQIPQIMGSGINVITRFSQTKDGELFMEEMKIPALKLLGMYLAQSACTFFYIFMLSHIGERIAYEMRKDLFSAIAQQDIAFFDIQRTGEIINRLTADIQDFKSSFKQTVSGGLRAATQIIGCSVSLVLISPQMTLFTLLCVPSVIVVGTIFGAVLRKTSRRAQAQIEKTTAVADEAVANIRTVRAFAMEDQERELFDTEAELSMEYYQKLGFGIGMFQAGEEPIFEWYINLKPVVPLRGGTIIPYHSLKGEIEFKNVNFAYPSRPEHIVLKNFNLKVPPGKTIAIVGASGNGKSTVVALIERFYDVNDGIITIDGTDIRNLDPTWLRQRALGLISQEPILFGTTVMENIRYGKPEASDLARDKKQFYLLHALDAESEKIVQSALEQARKGRTVIVIAHRLSTIQNADLIVVLHKGQIVEMGTHESLQQQKGYYWTLTYQQQHIPGG
ncbi:atp-binding cassette sub-family b [Holotrichia oblita]|uniref:Atp-binding cassette sub-family b n=1 Tax=Holotrichia oblita TaxID=644536 RepID=A0ACB9TKG7_HOLOL|nr:atp-binding cassette sub-family b [Holotrichia oblita]